MKDRTLYVITLVFFLAVLPKHVAELGADPTIMIAALTASAFALTMMSAMALMFDPDLDQTTIVTRRWGKWLVMTYVVINTLTFVLSSYTMRLVV